MVLRGFEADAGATRFSFTLILMASGKIIVQLSSVRDPSAITSSDGRQYTALSGILPIADTLLLSLSLFGSYRSMLQQQQGS